MGNRNTENAPTGNEIRNSGAIPYASQIPNDSDSDGESVASVLSNIGNKLRVVVTDLAIDTLNDEQTVALGGKAINQWCPVTAIVQMVDVGAGAAATGNFQITIGISTGGTQILAAIACTGVIGINTKLIIDLSAVVKPALPADATIYVKVTTKDTTAGVGHLAKVWLLGEIIPTAV